MRLGRVAQVQKKRITVRINFLTQVSVSSPSVLAFTLFPTIVDLAILLAAIGDVLPIVEKPTMSRFVTMTWKMRMMAFLRNGFANFRTAAPGVL